MEALSLQPPQRTGPSMNKGRSKQDYETPKEFIDAVTRRFGTLDFDLAASEENAKANEYFTEKDDALSRNWAHVSGSLLWLNPPFADIAPWAEKCALHASPTTRILLLVPAAVGSNWYAEHVHPHASVLAVRPRLSFDGINSFPKDLILAAYGFGVRGFDLWKWR